MKGDVWGPGLTVQEEVPQWEGRRLATSDGLAGGIRLVHAKVVRAIRRVRAASKERWGRVSDQ